MMKKKQVIKKRGGGMGEVSPRKAMAMGMKGGGSPKKKQVMKKRGGGMMKKRGGGMAKKK